MLKLHQNHATLIIAYLIILLMKDCIDIQQVSEILEKPYQNRLPLDNRILANLIHTSIPDCSEDQAKKLAYFVEQFHPQIQLSANSILLVLEDKQSNHFLYIQYNNQPILEKIESKYCLFIHGDNFLKSKGIPSNIEQQVKCFQRSVYFEDVPRKRLYSILKHAQVMELSYGQFVFSGILPSESRYIYYSRKGQFCYEMKEGEKHIEILNFKQGQLFNQTNELVYLEQDKPQQSVSDFCLTNIDKNKRKMSVRCKTSKGTIYKLPKEYFASHLLKYCQSKIQENIFKINDLLDQRIQNVQKLRKSNRNLLMQKVRRSSSLQIQSMIAQKISTARKSGLPKQPDPIVDISKKNQDYKTLKNQQAPRNRLYSKGQLMKLQLNPQKNESDMLLWKKSKCFRLKQISKSSQQPACKAETLLMFMKSSIHFQKTKRKPSVF